MMERRWGNVGVLVVVLLLVLSVNTFAFDAVFGDASAKSTAVNALAADDAGSSETIVQYVTRRELVESYSQYDNSDPLENETRATVFRAVVRSPGVHLSKLSKDTDIPRSTVRYHTRILAKEKLIAHELVRGKRRFYPTERDNLDVSLTAALEDEATAAVLEAVAHIGPASVSALASELDRAPSTVSYHLTRLADAGLIERERDGNAVLNRHSVKISSRALSIPAEKTSSSDSDQSE